MRGAAVQQGVTLGKMVNIVEDVTVGEEGKVNLRPQKPGIEQQASHEGSGVCLVDDQDVVLDVLDLEEGVHVLEEGGEVEVPVPEGDHDDHARAGLAVPRPEVTPGREESCPGLVLLVQVQVWPGGGQVQGGAPRQDWRLAECWSGLGLSLSSDHVILQSVIDKSGVLDK